MIINGPLRRIPWPVVDPNDAEALVWGGAKPDATADLLVLTVRLREPHGFGEHNDKDQNVSVASDC